MRDTPATNPRLAELARTRPEYAAIFARLDAEDANADPTPRPSGVEMMRALARVRRCPHFSTVCGCEYGSCSHPATTGPTSHTQCLACPILRDIQ